MNINLPEVMAQLDEQGFCILPGVLSGEHLRKAQKAFHAAMEETEQRGIPLTNPMLDPNGQNLRVNNLPDLGQDFIEMLRHPATWPVVQALLGDDALVSNFTANVALPGSGAMRIHSDQALVVPPPWTQSWAMNMIWCLDDVHEANGATRYLPGSHHYQSFEDVPADAEERLQPFTAPAGSVIAMEGRLWHTSGHNVTKAERRTMLFAYYTRSFIRQQVNWEAALSAETKSRLDDDARGLLGLPLHGNIHSNITGAGLVMRDGTETNIG